MPVSTMAPLPEDAMRKIPENEIGVNSTPEGDRVVISGVSGQYPQAYHVKDLSKILYEKLNPVSAEQLRWKTNHPEAFQYAGNIPDLDRFDAQFFKVFAQLGQEMDPMVRKTLEHTYQALYDAGVSPSELQRKNIGVFMTSGFTESEISFCDNINSETGRGLRLLASSRAMAANRISYWLNLTGPSTFMNQACTGSFAILSNAAHAIDSGVCEAAIIGSTDIFVTPRPIIQYNSVYKVCRDGKTKSFDENADGQAKTEAINIMFLQKAKDARRIYAEVVHVKSEFVGLPTENGYPKFGYKRDLGPVTKFLNKFYEEAGVSPQLIGYVECFGAADTDADLNELEAIETVFCKNRFKDHPLLIGSVRSNIGGNESCSGLSGIVKVLLAFETGKIAANMHCERPRRDVAALRENRMRIVTEHEDVHLSYAAVNGMSYSGTHGHILLRKYFKSKDNEKYKSTIPHLVFLSGRQDSSVQSVIDDLKSRPIDPEEIALLHTIHEQSIKGHLGRGFVILDTDEDQKTITVSEQVNYFDESDHPLWFVYSGMGSQWAGMGAQLMKIPIFAKAMYRCHKILEPKGIDLIHVITSNEKDIFDNILNSFIGIAAIQIGLTDVLSELGLKPDKIIGHSVGELGCAYADGCLTAEEVMLAVYSRGWVSTETPLIHGIMAAVGIGYMQIIDKIPAEIDIACHNGPDSCTISGPAEEMREFIAKLKSEGVFVKEVPSSNIAYHSRYIAVAGTKLLKLLSEVIVSPKPRSARWLSTSVPQAKWDDPTNQLSDAQYHTNNLLSPVLFEEVLSLVPPKAVLVEIAPHGLLQAILKRSLPECIHVPLTQRGHTNNPLFMLQASAKLYMNGFYPKVKILYPRVEFPVSTGTPQLSHLVKWAHEDKWYVPVYESPERRFTSTCTFKISTYDDEYSYLRGNSIGGKTVFPFAGVLVAVWDTLTMSLSKPRRQMAVEFRDVHLHSQPLMQANRVLNLRVVLQKGTGQFDVLNDISKVASGYIIANSLQTLQQSEDTTQVMGLDSQDVYKLFQEMDFYYSGDARSIHKANASFTQAQLLWNNNWVILLDGMIQLNALRRGGRPTLTHIQRLSINLKYHSLYTQDSIKASISEHYTRCGGVLMKDLRFRDLPLMRPDLIELEDMTRNVYDAQSIDTSCIENNFNDNYEVVLKTAKIGDLNALEWVSEPKLNDVGIPVTVHYAALNQRDVLIASGKTPFNIKDRRHAYGMDFSGVTESGARVMGVVASGAACRHLNATPHLLWPVPEHWSLEDAATVPSAYMQAYYCLCLKHKMQPGMSILVHGATGALGQAAVSLALALGCEVFATVSDTRKKRFLSRLFPQIKDDHIGNSRDVSFVYMVLNATKGNGCDVVLSCFGGKHKDYCLKCCKASGVTYDTSQIQSQENFMFGLSNLTKSRSYVVVDFPALIINGINDDIVALQALVSEGIARGIVRPLTRVTYAPGEATRALRLLAAARHRGRVLLRMKEFVPAALSIICTADHPHLIVSDDDSFGVQLAERLMQRGATQFHLHLPQITPYLCLKIKSWKENGVKVKVISKDLNDKDNVLNLVKQSALLGSVEGIYVAPTKIRDRKGSEHMNKLVTYLDEAARKWCKSIKFFAVLCTEHKFGEQTCILRSNSELPATMLCLSNIKQASEFCNLEDSGYKNMSTGVALDILERALLIKAPILQASSSHKTVFLLHEIATIAGINIEDAMEDSVSLKDLRLESECISAVQTLFRDKYNFTIADEDIPLLTIRKIHELQINFCKSELKELKGLEAFFSYVDPDELQATTEYIQMPTLIHCSKMTDEEFDATLTYLYIIPGLEGHHERFKVLCERLKLPALVLQPPDDHDIGSLTDTTQRYVNILVEKAALKDNFYILGYESGVNIALEILANLEDKGLTGTLFVVGCAPEQWRSALERQLPGDEAQLRASLATHMVSLQAKSAPPAPTDLRREHPGKARTSRLCEAAHARILQALRYAPRLRPLRSRLVLLHASLHGKSDCEAACEAQLQRHSAHPLAAYALPTPLPHAAHDLRVATIVNRHLAPELLTAFENSNLCDSYVVKA